ELFLAGSYAHGLAIFGRGFGDLEAALVALAQQIVRSGLLRLGCSQRHGDLEFFFGYRTITGISQPLARSAMGFAVLRRNAQQFFSLLLGRLKIMRLDSGVCRLRNGGEMGL